MKLCLCGCGQEVDEVHDYKGGHNLLTEECKDKRRQSLHDTNFVKVDAKKRSNRLCKCGCGQPVKYKYALYCVGHHNKGKPARNKGMHWKIREDCPKKLDGLSVEHKDNIRKAESGELNYFYGKHHKPESIVKMKKTLSKMMSGEGNAFYGEHHTEESKKIIGEKSKVGYKVKGENHPLWRGGKSFEPYTPEFSRQLKRLVRVRDGYSCQLCGVPERELIRRLHVHHIDYDKSNCYPNNLISLCNSCHVKTNVKREYWVVYFGELIKKRQNMGQTAISSLTNNENQSTIILPKVEADYI